MIQTNSLSESLDFLLSINWRSAVSGNVTRTPNSAQIYETQDLSAAELDAGVRFQPSSGNPVDLLLRTIRGTHPGGSPSVFISPG